MPAGLPAKIPRMYQPILQPILQPIIHFVHGNGFPALSYRSFLDQLAQHYQVVALPMHAHNPAYPVDNGWHGLARELIDELDRRYRQPVTLVGHSMGGVLSLMAARQHPEKVQAVILLDAPIVAGWRARVLQAAKAARLDKLGSPARFSERRRDQWPDREAAFQHYAARAAFANWSEEALRDYIEHGLAEDPRGVTLRFGRDVETAVYRTLPHHIGRMVKRGFPVPVGFIGGADSVESRQAGLDATRRLVGPHFKLLQGGHLFPMETPTQAAEAVHQMVCALLANPTPIHGDGRHG